MTRSARSASFQTRTARLKLAIRKKPYAVRISPSIRLGYRRNQTAGVWRVIAADGHGSSWMRKFAVADDFEESDGRSVLTFWEISGWKGLPKPVSTKWIKPPVRPPRPSRSR